MRSKAVLSGLVIEKPMHSPEYENLYSETYMGYTNIANLYELNFVEWRVEEGEKTASLTMYYGSLSTHLIVHTPRDTMKHTPEFYIPMSVMIGRNEPIQETIRECLYGARNYTALYVQSNYTFVPAITSLCKASIDEINEYVKVVKKK